MSFPFINKTWLLNNLKTRTAMNSKMSVFVICVEVFMYLLLHNLHDCAFKKNVDRVSKVLKSSKPHPQYMVSMKEHLNIQHLLFKYLVFFLFYVSFYLSVTSKSKTPTFYSFFFLLCWMWYLNYPAYLKVWKSTCECAWRFFFFYYDEFF